MAEKESELEHTYDNIFRLGVKSNRSFDLYGEERMSTIVHFRNRKISKSFHLKDSGISLRTNEKGKTGFAGCSLNVCDAEKLMQDASVPCDIPAEYVHLDFPEIERDVKMKNIHDSHLEHISCSTLEDLLQSLMAAVSGEQISSMDGYVHILTKKWIIGNSSGEETAVQETYIKVMLRVYARLLFKHAVNVEYQDGRKLEQISFDTLGESCSKKAKKSLNYKKVTTDDIPVVLDPSIVANLLYSVAKAMLSAENVYRKVSFLDTKSRLGSMTLIDDGTIPGGLRSHPVDGEGVKKGERTLVDNGHIVSYLHSLTTSDKFKVPPTGNSRRVGYMELPVIEPSNLKVVSDNIHSQKIIEEIKKGVYFGLSFDVPNMTNGDYFLTAQNAFMIENGEMSEPVRFPGINTTVCEFFDSIDMISKDTVVLNGVISPTVKLSAMRVSPSPAVYSGGLLW